MKQSLELGLSQQLKMTPQLQQAIRLLQLSTVELQAEIQEALDSNPLLEIQEEHENTVADSNYDASKNTESNVETEVVAAVDTDIEFQNSESMPDELPVDVNWEDTFSQQTFDHIPAKTAKSASSSGDYDPFATARKPEELLDHLYWQFDMAPFSVSDRVIGEAIIDGIDADGYLRTSMEDILATVSVDTEYEYDIDEVNTVLRRIQNFDPPGVASRNLQECLLIQLSHLSLDTPHVELAIRLVEAHMDDLGQHNYKDIMRALQISERRLHNALLLIQSLNPRPGTTVDPTEPEYIVPDVIVKKVNGCWVTDLNPEIASNLGINSTYSNMIKKRDNSEQNNYLKNNYNEARWFIKSLQSRNQTLLNVARCIVEKQQDFFEYGPEHMKPMVLFDIAEEVGMHESTISRVTTKKYMHTPKEIYELKYFFSSHIKTHDGGTASATAMRALIKKLIDEETKALSDNKIAQLLSEQGFEVARRTVAKYRESMSIPPSNERKKLLVTK